MVCEGDPVLYESDMSHRTLEQVNKIQSQHSSDTTIDKDKDSIKLQLARRCLERNIPYLLFRDLPCLPKDSIKLQLARRCLERNIPYLETCRGFQILNAACGGALYRITTIVVFIFSMAGSEDDSIMDLLKGYIARQADLQDIAGKLDSDGLNVRTLLALSESELCELMGDYLPKGSCRGTRLGFVSAIRSRKKLTHEGVPLSKRAKLSTEEQECARETYFAKLLEPPADLPRTRSELEEVLGQIPVKLPVRKFIYQKVKAAEFVTLQSPEEAEELAGLVTGLFSVMEGARSTNEATDSAHLFLLTGQFLDYLNSEAPASMKLQNVLIRLDSPNPWSSQTASISLKGLSRPDFQMFVKGCLMLRWENEYNYESLAYALRENTEKLKVWSPLFYGALPYVIGGYCAGKQFQWLRLVPDGEKVVHHFISPTYDLTTLTDVAAFLHSIVRMHGVLQKLQEKLKHRISLMLYTQKEGGDGGTVTIYPHVVKKEILDVDKEIGTLREALSELITGSKYLIQGEVRKGRKKTVLLLNPVGDPNSKPVTLKELEDATHDILCGLNDLHKAGYTHRDIHWGNCIKVNVTGEWKWVLIDLEAAGVDDEEWSGPNLKVWDDATLVGKGRKKRYTNASDIYLLGKLICEWLDETSGRDEKGYAVMKSRGEKMMRERLPAVKVKREFCKRSCERCLVFGC